MKKLFILMVAVMTVFTACKEKNEPGNDSDVQDTTIAGALKGKFSVAKGKQVQFSQGNLQYQASTKTWRFAENQWDTIGCNWEESGRISNNNGWIDIFCWGTGSNPTNTSTDYNDYSTFTDWGVNKVNNGGNTANQWRTLTIDEWLYLINQRNAAKELCGVGTVRGIHGLIILPDDWNTPSDMIWQGVLSGWETNKYTASEWSKMEQEGAVFLPFIVSSKTIMGGTRIEWHGGFWSATPCSNVFFAYHLPFRSDYSGLGNVGGDTRNRSVGLAVRLVR